MRVKEGCGSRLCFVLVMLKYLVDPIIAISIFDAKSQSQ